MKSLIVNSAKICKSWYPIRTISQSILLNSCEFSTIKSQTIKQSKNPIVEKSKIIQPIILQNLTTRQQYEKQAMKIIGSYITIDEISNRSEGIKSLLLTLIKVLEYDKQNNARKFYQQNKESLDKIIYDLKCTNSQNHMKPSQILLTFYVCKLASDCGYHNTIEGFDYRSAIRLVNHIPNIEKEQVAQPLTMEEVVFGYWVMSRLGCSNHEFKWKSYLMMLRVWVNWKIQASRKFTISQKGQKVYEKLQPIIPFEQLSALLSTYYTEEYHLNSQYKTFQMLIGIIFVSRSDYTSYEQLQQNESMFLQTVGYLVGLQLHWFNGQAYHELMQIMHLMSQSIEKKLVSWVSKDVQIQNSFVPNKSLGDFLAENKFQTYQMLKKANRLAECQMDGFTQEDVYRYFIFLNEIRQNRAKFHNLASDHFKKIQFMLIEILDRYYDVKVVKNQQMSQKDLSICTRIWIKKSQIALQDLQVQIEKHENHQMKPEIIQNTLARIVTQFQSLVKILSQKLSEYLKNMEGKLQTKKRQYLTVKQKQAEEQKNLYLKQIETNIVKPLVDFLYAHGKHTLLNTQLISSQKMQLIQVLEDLLTLVYGDKVQAQQGISQGKILTIQNKYFWIMKFMRIQSVNVTDNKIFLKQFQSFLLENVVKNNAAKQPHHYSVVSIYNLYAYMCKLQEKMMKNEENNRTTNPQRNQNIQVQNFVKKSQYKYFLAYKSYLAGLIFMGNNSKIQNDTEQKKIQTIQVPKKLRVDHLFINSHETNDKEKDNNNQSKSSYTKSANQFSIQNFFNIVFRWNRYYNHKILAQQLLLSLFGTPQLLEERINEYVKNSNQRSGENYYQLIYLILLAGRNQVDTTGVTHTLELKVIKSKLVQILVQKAKGSLIMIVIRDVIGPRKSSFLKNPPLKYRQKPYSIFETMSRQSGQRKKQIVSEFLQHFTSNPTQMFSCVEILLMNLQLWGKDRLQIMSDIVLPWLLIRKKKGEIHPSTIHFYLNVVCRLIRFSMINIPRQNQQFTELISQIMCDLFKNLQRNGKEYNYADLTGYIIDMNYFIRRKKLNCKVLHDILLTCQHNLMNTGNTLNIQKGKESNYFLKLALQLEKTLELARKQLNLTDFNSSEKHLQSTQSKNEKKGNFRFNNVFETTSKSQNIGINKVGKGMFNKKVLKEQSKSSDIGTNKKDNSGIFGKKKLQSKEQIK